MNSDFTLNDFANHIRNMRPSMKEMIRRMPGMAEMNPTGEDPGVALQRVLRMIDAMTPEERSESALIDETRRAQIAAGAEVEPKEVSDFLKNFAKVRALMKAMLSMSIWQRIKIVLGFQRFPFPPPPEA